MTDSLRASRGVFDMGAARPAVRVEPMARELQRRDGFPISGRPAVANLGDRQ